MTVKRYGKQGEYVLYEDYRMLEHRMQTAQRMFLALAGGPPPPGSPEVVEVRISSDLLRKIAADCGE